MEHVEELLDFSEYTTELEQALEELSDVCAKVLVDDLQEHPDEYFSNDSDIKQETLVRITSTLAKKLEEATNSNAISLVVENVEVWKTHVNSDISSEEEIVYSPVNYLDEDRKLIVLSIVVSMPNMDSGIVFAIEISPESLL